MKIALSRLTTKGLATLAHRTIDSSKSGKYKVVEGNELLAQIEKVIPEYDNVYGKLTFSGKGEAVLLADKERDTAFSGIKSFVKGYSSLKTMPHAEDAGNLYNLLMTHAKGVESLSYDKEDAVLFTLFGELDKPENQTRLTNLGIMPQYEELKNLNKKFKTLYAEQSEENAELRSLGTATNVRKRLETALNNYFKLLAAMKDVPGWELIYADINELVKAARNSSLPGGDKEEEAK